MTSVKGYGQEIDLASLKRFVQGYSPERKEEINELLETGQSEQIHSETTIVEREVSKTIF